MTMSSLEPLSHQVAGHPDGVQSLEGGRLVVKACLPRELRFYQQVQQAVQTSQTRQTELLSRLLQFMPRCYGSWQDYAGSTAATADSEPEPRIVLENLTFGYTRPNVCDLKLGTQLWDEEASDEKRARMDKAAASTTSGSHGVRLTGWQTYDSETRQFHRVPKTFGKTIGAQHLELGMRMLLACPEPGDAQSADSVLAGTSLDSRLPQLPAEIVEQLLRQDVLKHLEELRDIFGELEVRMRGASLLLVSEGDVEQAQPKAEVRLIDFAHATLVPGEGPDQGVLLGIETVLHLVKKQLDRLQSRKQDTTV